ncbi:MAG: DUF115 domain-containing protein [Treponema sp.]|nr:DUF115 domain-containing protein [Treponema sp.]
MDKRRYAFLKSRSGETVPAIVLESADTRPLHSMVDPKREAQRLVSTISEDTGFVVFLGLGGGFAPEAALALTVAQVVVIDFDRDGIDELLSSKDYTPLLENERFCLLTDPSCEEIKKIILEKYKPALCGGIKTIPLRTRTDFDLPLFDAAAQAIQEAIETVSSDYSVQAHFGRRWFSNIIRNIKTTGIVHENFLKEKFSSFVSEAVIVAAGPSLDLQISALAECKSRNAFIICSDTAFPVLLNHGIEPNAVVSIDCQHISYYHFMGCCRKLHNIPLILDIASPPLLSRLSPSPVFFSSGHPLARYISAYWQPFPYLDTSGGNVTYACLSLAENLGARLITLFGADFSYINSRTYARGTYIYPFFEKKQNRVSPMEALFSTFLYRSLFLPPENEGNQKQNYHETSSLRFYRKKLEEKASMIDAQISYAKGLGAHINLYKTPNRIKQAETSMSAKKTNGGASNIACGAVFLEQYRDDIAALPEAKNQDYLNRLNSKERQIFTTLLPYIAFNKRRNPNLKTEELIEITKRRCIEEIDMVMVSSCK